MKVEKFDRQTVKILRQEIQMTLDIFNEEYGVTIKLGSITFEDYKFTCRLTATTEMPEGVKTSEQKYDDVMLPLLLKGYNLPPDCIGRTIVYKHQSYTVIAIDAKKKKYPVILVRADGKRIKAAPGFVNLHLK